MIDVKRPFRKNSLRLAMLMSLLVGIILAVLIFLAVKMGSSLYIGNRYLSEESREWRETNYAKELQGYVDEKALASTDTEELASWAQSNRYLYIMVHKDDQLLFESELPDSGSDGEVNSGGEGGSADKDPDGIVFPDTGIGIERPTREDLIKYAEEKDSHLIVMADGNVLVSMADYSEYFYYDLFNIVSVVAAMLVLLLVIMLHTHRVTNRITRLASDVTVVAGGDMEHPIGVAGADEIGKLSVDVENMRSSMVQKVAAERAALDANAELITSMSHDIRTPLTVLLGYLEVMRLQAPDAAMSKYIDASEKTALRLKKLSDDMFNYFLVFGGGAAEVENAEYDAYMLLEQMLAEHCLLLKEQDYILESNLDACRDELEGIRLSTDAPKLMRIFENLFSNILKYADKSHPVQIFARVDDGKLLLTFSNRVSAATEKVDSNGIGIKTCEKIAEALEVGFHVRGGDETFSVDVVLKCKKSDLLT